MKTWSTNSPCPLVPTWLDLVKLDLATLLWLFFGLSTIIGSLYICNLFIFNLFICLRNWIHLLLYGIPKRWYQEKVISFHSPTTATGLGIEPHTVWGTTCGSLLCTGEGLDIGKRTKIWHIVTVRNHGAYCSHWTLNLKATLIWLTICCCFFLNMNFL